MTPDEWRIANGLPELPASSVDMLQLMLDGIIQITPESLFVMLLLNMDRLSALEEGP